MPRFLDCQLNGLDTVTYQDLWASLLGDLEFWVYGILVSWVFGGSVLWVESVLWVFGSLDFTAWGFRILGLRYSG